jgi:hypothetical protein
MGTSLRGVWVGWKVMFFGGAWIAALPLVSFPRAEKKYAALARRISRCSTLKRKIYVFPTVSHQMQPSPLMQNMRGLDGGGGAVFDTEFDVNLFQMFV